MAGGAAADRGVSVSENEPTPEPTQETKAPERNEPAPWFGYIGLMLAIVSMFVGLLLVVVGAIWFIRWFGR